jgi:hypothetical protein
MKWNTRKKESRPPRTLSPIPFNRSIKVDFPFTPYLKLMQRSPKFSSNFLINGSGPAHVKELKEHFVLLFLSCFLQKSCNTAHNSLPTIEAV